jgi:ferredoxin-NADP reductase
MFTMEAGPPDALRRALASRLVAALATPHPVDRYLAALHPLWRLEAVTARVIAVRRETERAVTLTLRPSRSWRGFRAGQHVRVGVDVDGIRRTRCYSLSSSPDGASGLVEVTVARHPYGLVSRFIHDRVRAGTVVALSQAEGDFTLPARPPPHLLFITGGSGITPVMSMLRTALGRGYDGRIDLVHYARTRHDVIFGRELRALADARGGFRFTLALTGEPPSAQDLGGHFTEHALARVVPGYADAETWVSGPPGLIEAVATTWKALGRTDGLHVERFGAAPRIASADAVGATVELSRSGRRIASDGRSLLEQAEAAGLAPAFGCRRGICRTCVRRKTSGTVRDVVTGALSSEPEEDIRLCVSVPLGDVTLDL